ncbi:Putative phosphoribosylaminoimidazole-succinocarboxamide synthase 2 [Frankliniella fusca]|uniref:Phosphoribosylaminoimidazole-succinocarboxamide synthase 2 n=1 Tax=Frankliniella fusca TaxID=407009 RepID=A0AAE1LIX6_9NEOP|nr:Putative phosphoribosylaminoimidazole-succinocarboxamide synthase 2 [Frankliniella fusca]
MSSESTAESLSNEPVNPNLHVESFGMYRNRTPCSIGLFGLGKCSSTTILKRDLDDYQPKLLKLRTEYLKNYNNKQQRSCGVKLQCSGSRTQDLRQNQYSDYVKSRQFGCGQFLLVPGQVRCVGCRLYCHKIVKGEIERRKKEREIMEAEGIHYTEPEDPGSPDISDCESESTSVTTSQSAGTSHSQRNKRLLSDEDFSTPPEIAREKLNNALCSLANQDEDWTRKLQKVILFYEDDRHSRLLPGKKDFKTVKIDGERVQMQKRLLLLTVGELYEVFKEECPAYEVSISRFAELRPLYIVLAGAAGTHSVCVCTIHQNVKLMMYGAKLHEGAKDMEGLTSVSECLSMIICNVPKEECYFGTCKNCPGVSDIVEKIQLIFDLNMVSIVEYKQWVSVDRSDLITVTQDSDEYIDVFCDRLKDPVEHDFLAKQQGNFFCEIKSNLKEGEVFVVGNFSMNYKPVIQDAAQSYHRSNASITLHPFVCYFSASGVVEHKSYAMISNYLIHDTAAVYRFQLKLIERLKVEIPNLKKIIYSSDGARSQFKNKKKVANLCHHFEDFDVEAEWHFSATSHGKGASDGVGGSLKRSAYKESLRGPYEGHILSAEDLVNFVN